MPQTQLYKFDELVVQNVKVRKGQLLRGYCRSYDRKLQDTVCESCDLRYIIIALSVPVAWWHRVVLQCRNSNVRVNTMLSTWLFSLANARDTFVPSPPVQQCWEPKFMCRAILRLVQVLVIAILFHTIRQGEKAICPQNTACDSVADTSPRYSLRCNVIVTARATILEIVKHVKCIKEVAAKDVTRTVPCMGPRRILAATATHPSSQPRLTGVPRETVSKMAQD